MRSYFSCFEYFLLSKKYVSQNFYFLRHSFFTVFNVDYCISSFQTSNSSFGIFKILNRCLWSVNLKKVNLKIASWDAIKVINQVGSVVLTGLFCMAINIGKQLRIKRNCMNMNPFIQVTKYSTHKYFKIKWAFRLFYKKFPALKQAFNFWQMIDTESQFKRPFPRVF